MRLFTTDALFPWDKLPDSPDLAALRFLLDLLRLGGAREAQDGLHRL